jgi:hypothetical protein
VSETQTHPFGRQDIPLVTPATGRNDTHTRRQSLMANYSNPTETSIFAEKVDHPDPQVGEPEECTVTTPDSTPPTPNKTCIGTFLWNCLIVRLK